MALLAAMCRHPNPERSGPFMKLLVVEDEVKTGD